MSERNDSMRTCPPCKTPERCLGLNGECGMVLDKQRGWLADMRLPCFCQDTRGGGLTPSTKRLVLQEKSMNDALRRALDFDPLDAAEKITGLDHHNNDSVAWLGMALMQARRPKLNAMLDAADDVKFSEPMGSYLAKVERMGFRLVLDDAIDDGTGNKYRIFWRDGALLAFDSYWGDKSVNGGSVFLNYRGPREALHRCSNGWINGTEPPVWDVSRDCREGLRYALDLMAAQGEILPKWVRRPCLWLLHYHDSKQDGYDHAAMTEARIARLPAEVREAITPELPARGV